MRYHRRSWQKQSRGMHPIISPIPGSNPNPKRITQMRIVLVAMMRLVCCIFFVPRCGEQRLSYHSFEHRKCGRDL